MKSGSHPRHVGRYLIFDPIASGGMATVHIGRLLGPIGFSRVVAIKCLHPHLQKQPEFVSMFMDEARLAARVRHPNVVDVLDVVLTSDALLLVMDYVHGETMAKLIGRHRSLKQPFPPKFATSVVGSVLHGLHAAHEALNDQGEPLGIVHRDVSPQNVIVGRDGVARVTDFGIAKAAERIQVTRTGELKGKLEYMSREQLFLEPVDRRTDVYAASVVLWEALTGKRLFRADNELEIRELVAAGVSQPPSEFATDLPEDLDAVVMRGLAVHAGDRFDTAQEMAQELERVMGGVASPSEIAEWIEGVSRDTLAGRAAIVAAAEGYDAGDAVRDSSPIARLSNPSRDEVTEGYEADDGKQASITASYTDMDAPDQSVEADSATHQAPRRASSSLPSSESAGLVTTKPQPRVRRLLLASLGGFGLACLVLGLALLFARSALLSDRVEPGSSVGQFDTNPIASATTQPPLPSAPEPTEPLLGAEPSDLDGGEEAHDSEADAEPDNRPRLRPPATRKHPPMSPSKSCNPPYTVDKQGVRIPKRHCF